MPRDDTNTRLCGLGQKFALVGATVLSDLGELEMDPKEIIDFLQTAARSVGAEVTSPWFYLQLGLILAAAGIAYAAEAALRARFDTTALTMRWPVPLRRLARVLIGSFSTALFALLIIAARVVMAHSTWPSRSYLLVVAAKL